jgi:hypothetical protein
MSAPTELPDKPNMSERLVRLAQVSEAARALAPTKAPEQLSGSTKSSNLSARSNIASGYISCVAARDRLLDPDICPASLSPLERKSSLLGLIGLGVALTVVLTKVHFPLAEIWSQPPVDRTVELAASAPPLVVRAEPAMSRLIIEASQGVSGEPAPLGLTLHGLAEDAAVIITGLLPGMSLSTGDAFGADAWRVPATNLPDAWIGPPENFVGSAYLVAELLLSDNKIADRQVIRIEWLPAISPAPARRQLDHEEIATAGASSTLRTLQSSASSDTTSKENASDVPAFKNFSQENTRKASRSQDRRRMAAEPASWRGDRADFWIARRYPKDDNRRASSAAAYAREGTPVPRPRRGPSDSGPQELSP